jgi:hypothetical protein
VTSRAAQLQTRRRLLMAESAVQRESLKVDGTRIGETLRAVDRSVAAVQGLARNPWVIGAAVVGLLLLRRHPVASWALRGVALASTARRAMATLEGLAANRPESGRPPG